MVVIGAADALSLNSATATSPFSSGLANTQCPPLLETTLEGAKAILLSITASRDLSLWEVNEAARAVQEAAHPDANIIFGAMIDEKLEDEVWITVVATGYGESKPPAHERDAFREPLGEPRVTRNREPVRASSRSSIDVDVPEFIPKF